MSVFVGYVSRELFFTLHFGYTSGAMAKKKLKIEPIADKAQKSNKSPKPAPVPLPENEWAFHKVPKVELRYCAKWELTRLCGKKQKPWLQLTDKAKARVILQEHTSLQEIPASVGHVLVTSTLRHFFGKEYSALKVVTYLVDFRESESRLLETFRRWLKSSPHRKKWQRQPKPPSDRGRNLLMKIVILRATDAGLTREAAISHTSELWEKWNLKHATTGILSAPHWSRALRLAKKMREKPPIEPVDKASFVKVDPPYSGRVVREPLTRVVIGGESVLVGCCKLVAEPQKG